MSHGFVPPPHLSVDNLGSDEITKFYTAKSWAKEAAKSLVRHRQSLDKASGEYTQNYMCQVTKMHGRFMPNVISKSGARERAKSPLYDIRDHPVRPMDEYTCQKH